MENIFEFQRVARDLINAEIFNEDNGVNEDYGLIEVPRIIIPDRKNPFLLYSDVKFTHRFRLPKILTMNIIEMIYPNEFTREDFVLDFKGRYIPNWMSVLAALRFYGSGAHQIVIGDTLGLSQPVVSRCVQKVSKLISNHLPRFIYIRPENLQFYKQEFKKIAGFPDVIGCIDCTHVKIISPGKNRAESFRNRKTTFSFNVQAVCNPQLMFTDIVTRWPGSTHDSTIWQRCGLLAKFERGEFGNGHLLGDSGYACSEFILTPYRIPNTPAEVQYNSAQITTRCPIERVFGIWKRRFICLRDPLHTVKETTQLIISACAILHNICRQYNLPDIPAEGNVADEVLVNPITFDDPPLRNRGAAKRNSIVHSHFSNR